MHTKRRSVRWTVLSLKQKHLIRRPVIWGWLAWSWWVWKLWGSMVIFFKYIDFISALRIRRAPCRPPVPAPIVIIISDFGISCVQFFLYAVVALRFILFLGRHETIQYDEAEIKTSAKVSVLAKQWDNREHSLTKVLRLTHHAGKGFSMRYHPRLYASSLFVASQSWFNRCFKPFSHPNVGF